MASPKSRTGRDGRFSIDEVPGPFAQLRASHPFRVRVLQRARVGDAEVRLVSLRGAVVRVRVEAHDGESMRGTVRVAQGDVQLAPTHEGEDTQIIRQISPGPAHVLAETWGGVLLRPRPLDLRDGDDVTVTVRAQPTCALPVVVRLPDGSAARPSFVRVQRADTPEQLTIRREALTPEQQDILWELSEFAGGLELERGARYRLTWAHPRHPDLRAETEINLESGCPGPAELIARPRRRGGGR